MRTVYVFSVVGCLAFFPSGDSWGQITADKIQISGCGAMEMGQVVHGWYDKGQLDHKWQEHFWGKLTAAAETNERTNLQFGFEFHYQYSAKTAFTFIPSFFPIVTFNLDRADLTYKVLEGEIPVNLQVGYFPFKYNPSARNLGEYLFRSGIHPTFVTNTFDWPMNRLLGFNVGNTLFKNSDLFSLEHNFLLTSETETYPYGDVSISYLASFHVYEKALSLGGGISAYRILPVDEMATTPHKGGANGTIAEIKNVRPGLDPLGNPITVGDTTFFSFAGTKLMFHATADLKPLIKLFFPLDIFGKEDLKLYGELAILGLKNDSVYVDSAHGIGTNPDFTVRYDLRNERMPIMLGFNFPTFKFLDVVSFEWEFWENRYLNNRFNQVCGTDGTRYPLPTRIAVPGHSLDSNSAGTIKWSVYAKKQFKNIGVVAQFGRDHRQVFVMADPRFSDYGDNLIRAKDWYYLIKIGYGF